MAMTIFIIFLILIALILIVSYICYCICFAVPNDYRLDPYDIPKGKQYQSIKETIVKTIDGAIDLPYENVYIVSHDGLRLHGKYYESKPGAPLAIFFHGYRSSGLRDFAGIMLLALNSGCNALVVDQRAHEDSEGRCLTFGILERQDCMCWVQYALDRWGNVPVLLGGLSMGASTVMMASNLPLPENVRGILADCGYTSPKEIIIKVMNDMKYPPALLYPFVKLGARIYGKFDLEAISSCEALAETKLPLLLVHGEDDKFVPCDMTRRNYAACNSEKYLLTVPGAGHGISYLTDYETYRDIVLRFFNKIGFI